ncbi:MAG: aminopeptidase P family protein [Acidimicrobiia bacterium]|nr:aminopeptidase P family protein [Acidimicrobiia bacterium]
MQDRSIDCLALSAGSDLTYLCGYDAMPLERITLLVIGTYGPPTLVVPELEAPRLEMPDGLVELRAWRDGEDMIKVVAAELRRACPPAPIIAVSERMWAGTLLSVQDAFRHARFVPAGRVMEPLRVVKSPVELDMLQAAAAAVDRVVSAYSDVEWVGRTEADVAREISGLLRDAGHARVNFVIVASGPNAASPHHTAGARVIEPGDAIVVDVGGTLGGYCSDITRVVCVGEPGGDVARAYGNLRAAQEAAVAHVHPGVSAESVDAVARAGLAETGWGDAFIHRTGHGIGMDEHEAPYIVAGNNSPLETGMCFSIEPGIYVPGVFGLRLEDIVAVTDEGVEPLNTAAHDLIHV